MRTHAVAMAAVALCALLAASPANAAEDLSDVYPPTKGWSETGLVCRSNPEDVWRLSSFEFGHGSELAISGKGAEVVFGVHETNALWAVVFPDKPVKIKSRLPGNGEKVAAIFLRFSPYDLPRLFPKKTVKGQGSPALCARAARVFAKKIGWNWCTPSGNTTIVPRGSLIIDTDTDAGARRFYFVDRASGKVEYVDEFEDQPLPPLAPITGDEARDVFDAVFEAFDSEYAGFVLLPELEWEKLGKTHRKLVAKQRTAFDAAAVIAGLLANLEDLHVWVRAGDDWLPGFTRERPLNANWGATAKLVGGMREMGSEIYWGRTDDDIGYVNVSGLSDSEMVAQFDAALEELGDTWALVVDLRFNGGGDEGFAQQIAGRFVDTERIYSKNRYRSGPKHDDLGPLLDRTFAPRGPWRYSAPIVCLQGRKTMSSAESMALMLAQCPGAVTMGDSTAGSSANPRRLEPGHGIVVNLPRWLDMDPDENPIEHVGVAPGIAIDATEADFSPDADVVMSRALGHLRKIPVLDRKPAHEE